MDNYKYKEGDHVRIISNGVMGEIVDIFSGKHGKLFYTVQTDEEYLPYDPEAYNAGRFLLYDCVEDNLQLHPKETLCM